MSNHIGILSNDSPSLHGLAARVLGQEKRGDLAEVYRLTHEAGGCDEGPNRRTPGASFNPRPARIVENLWIETKIPTFRCFSAAVFSALNRLKIEVLEVDRFKDALDLAKMVLSIKEPADYIKCSMEVKAIFLCRMLDNVRHVHLWGLSPMKDEEKYESYLEFISKLPDQERFESQVKERVRGYISLRRQGVVVSM